MRRYAPSNWGSGTSLSSRTRFGGTVAKYPRRKLVLTSPVELPLHGRLNKLEISKEELLRLWATLQRETGLAIHTNERVDAVTRDPDGAFGSSRRRAAPTARSP